MNMLTNIILLVQILSALAMIGLILIQHGKGADMGAAFGSGSSGSANFLSRTTAVLAAVFFVATLALAFLGNARPAASSTGSVLERATVTSPATPDTQIPASGASTVPAPTAPATVPGGAAQIPTK